MLSSKQRAKLRAFANQIEASVMVGKDGITETVMGQILTDLSAHELVKIAIMPNADVDAKQTINELAKILDAEPVQAIGRKMVLYKYSTKCKNHVLANDN